MGSCEFSVLVDGVREIPGRYIHGNELTLQGRIVLKVLYVCEQTSTSMHTCTYVGCGLYDSLNGDSTCVAYLFNVYLNFIIHDK